MVMKRITPISILLTLIILAFAVFLLFRPSLAGNNEPTLEASLESLLVDTGQNEGYARALVPGAIQFPRDLGPHPDYQTEWWYYTGNLETADGRPFGFQFTIFRRTLTPPGEASMAEGEASDWRTNQVYLAHFTISDIAKDKFYVAERFSRGAAGLAGAQADPYRVWLEDWMIAETAGGRVQLKAQTDEVALDLTLTQTLPPVLHGDEGLSPKGPEPGNASYYYSIVQQQATGTVMINGRLSAVSGLAWKDHEYSTSALSPGAVGWDWFSLQLDNGGALMLFQIRRDDGTLEATSSGSYVTPEGEVRDLRLGDWRLEILDKWRSPESGAEYPAGWRITIPSLELELEGRPLMPNQELNVSTTYWEGAVSFAGSLGGRPLNASGYIELTGYGGSMEGRL
jgi:predicted secreted hydrolase